MDSSKNILKYRLCFSVQLILVYILGQVLLDLTISEKTDIVRFEFLLKYVLYSFHTK